MKDYFEAALYMFIGLAVIFGIAAIITAFPQGAMYALAVFVFALLYHTILTAIRSQRKINEIRRRYE